MKAILLTVVAASLMAGCASRKPIVVPHVPFDVAEYEAFSRPGTGVIKGQVFAKTIGGDVKKGAGNSVTLMPATKYREGWYWQAKNQGRAMPPGDSRHLQYDQTKVTDGEGRFEFKDIPAGQYYLVSQISWETVSSNQYSRRLGLTDTQGGLVLGSVKVENDKTAEVMLTR